MLQLRALAEPLLWKRKKHAKHTEGADSEGNAQEEDERWGRFCVLLAQKTTPQAEFWSWRLTSGLAETSAAVVALS